MLLCALAGTGFGDDGPEPVIRSGDFILAKGKVRNCEDLGEFVIAYGYVADQETRILDHDLSAAGLRPSELLANPEQAIGEAIGRQPRTLRIEVLTEDAFVARQGEFDADIRNYRLAIKTCDRRLDEFRGKSRNVAESIPKNSTHSITQTEVAHVG